MLRDRWYISLLILFFLALSVAILLARWHTLLGRVPLAPVAPYVAAANLTPATDTASARSEPAQSATIVNINTAAIAELQRLPGIGPVLATRIVEYRSHHGPFERLDDLLAVEGIGAAKLAALHELAETGATD